jgi:hypothetical protein
MCFETISCAFLFTSWLRCCAVFPLEKSIFTIPLADLVQLIVLGVVISAVLLFQDTFFGHLLILAPAMAVATLLKLIGVIPALAYSSQSERSLELVH